MKRIYRFFVIICICVSTIVSQQPIQNEPMLETRKYSAVIGQERGIIITQAGDNYPVTFQQTFITRPKVGLSIYNLHYEYDPKFSVSIIRSQRTGFTMQIAGISSLVDNQVYVMYMATNFDDIGIFVSGIQQTSGLNSANRNRITTNRTQSLTFDFTTITGDNPRPIFQQNTTLSDISLTLYMNGIISTSQNTNNGYARNYTFFSITPQFNNTNFYLVNIQIRSTFGDVTIQSIQFTSIFFNKQVVLNNFQMIGSSIALQDFGGQFYKSIKAVETQSLPYIQQFDNSINYFFGVNKIQCFSGQSINLLAVESFKFNDQGRLQSIILTFETQKYTYIRNFNYDYILYKKKACSDSSCQVPCDDPKLPSFKAEEGDTFCIPCFYSCATCQNRAACTSCPVTRIPQDNYCQCANDTLYDDFTSLQCQSCFQQNFCRTCQRKQQCLSCYINQNFFYNQVLRKCQCAPSYYVSPRDLQDLSFVDKIGQTCAKCPEYCIYCKDQQSCEACQVQSYLLRQSQKLNDNTIVTCAQICNDKEIYNTQNFRCSSYNGDQTLFNQEGRFGFQWQYQVSTENPNQILIDVLFSQRNISSFYFQNSQANYYFENQGDFNQQNNNQNIQEGQGNFFYDDGRQHIQGYTRQSSSTNFGGAGGIGVESETNEAAGGGEAGTSTADSNSGLSQFDFGSQFFDPSALRGQYYGQGQAAFFKNEYMKYTPKAKYFDQYDIPFGKHKLSNQTYFSENFVDAIERNMVFKIQNQTLPYTIKPISANQIQLIVRPEKSYLMKNATIQFRNPALIRSENTTLQTPEKTLQLDRLDYYPQSLLSSSRDLKQTTGSIVQVLWGVCKYILFIGFGWTVMPLMLVMQYIMGHNYINSQLPLNLEQFLASFKDFKNPSILFDPQRKEMDRNVVNHPQIYKRVKTYQKFDEGIDFMKNSFQLFFTPLLSFGLLFLLIGANCLFRLCNRDATLISQYLAPRAGHHAAAYTLVQALPVSFFFFGQLKDTRFNSLKSPNSVYPSFNTGIAFASFFASVIIPMVLLTGLYQLFNRQNKRGFFKNAKLFSGKQDKNAFNNHKCMACPLWGGKTDKIGSYVLGGAVFMLPLIIGFFLAQFIGSYPWQITGLLIFNVIFFAFVASSKHFDSKVAKIYLILSSILLIAYELVHAGISSNRALSTIDQWNIGYLGVGLLLALLLAALLFSMYLIFKTIRCIYTNIIKPRGCFPKYNKGKFVSNQIQQEGEALRNIATGRDADRRVTNLKSKMNLDNPLSSQQRFLSRDSNYVGAPVLLQTRKDVYRQNLLYDRPAGLGGAEYVGAQSKQKYIFPAWSADMLFKQKTLTIDAKDNIYRANTDYMIGNYDDLRKEKIASSKYVQGRSMYEQMQMGNFKGANRTYQNIKINGESMGYSIDNQMYIVKSGNGELYRLSAQQFKQLQSGRLNLRSMNRIVINDGKNGNIKVQNGSIFQSDYNSEEEMLGNRQNVLQEQIYYIKGEQFKRVGFQNGKIVLQSTRTGSKKYISEKQLIESRQNIASETNVTKVVLETQSAYEIYGDSCIFKGVQDNKYVFLNQKTKKKIYLDEAQLAKIMKSQSFRKKISSSGQLLLESNRNQVIGSQRYIKKNILTYIGLGQDPETYQFKDQNGQIYEIGGVDPKYQAYFDQSGNIWQNGKIIITKQQMQGQEDQQIIEQQILQQQVIPQKVTNRHISLKSITSNASMNLETVLKSGQQYKLIILNKSYKQIDDNYNYSQRDIVTTLPYVRAEQVSREVDRILGTYEGVKILLQNRKNSQQKYYIGE